MARASSEPLYVSRNHLEGSLIDASLDRVLAACRKHLVTGVVRVHTRGRDGVLELRAGVVDRAHTGELSGDAALAILRNTSDGWYEVAQRLPELSGDLAPASAMEGDIDGVPLIALMRHCEDHALTCTITVISRFDRACIDYRAGDISRVELNGFIDDDVLPQVLAWPDARFRVAAPPLDLDIEGWPVTRRAPTSPFLIGKEPAPRRAPITIPVPAAEPPPPPTRTASGSIVVAPMAHPPLRSILAELPPVAPPRPLRAETWTPRRDRTSRTRRAARRSSPRLLASGPGYDWGNTADVLWLMIAFGLLLAMGIGGALLL